jgi:hypothetical protein
MYSQLSRDLIRPFSLESLSLELPSFRRKTDSSCTRLVHFRRICCERLSLLLRHFRHSTHVDTCRHRNPLHVNQHREVFYILDQLSAKQTLLEPLDCPQLLAMKNSRRRRKRGTVRPSWCRQLWPEKLFLRMLIVGPGKMFPMQNTGQVGRWADILANDLTLWPGRYQPPSSGKLGPFRSLDTAKTRAGRGRTVHVLASTRTGVAAAEKKKRHLIRTVFVTSTDCAYSAWVVLQAGAGGSQGGVTSRSWRQASWPKRIIRRGSKRRFEGAPDVQLSMSTVETRLKGLSSFNSWYFSNAGSKVVVDVQ